MQQFTENVKLLFLAISPLKLCFTNPSVCVLAVNVQTDLLSYFNCCLKTIFFIIGNMFIYSIDDTPVVSYNPLNKSPVSQ